MFDGYLPSCEEVISKKMYIHQMYQISLYSAVASHESDMMTNIMKCHLQSKCHRTLIFRRVVKLQYETKDISHDVYH